MLPLHSKKFALTSIMLAITSQHAMAIGLDAHEHGSANLDIAIDGNIIEMSFESPAVNIVGFEYVTKDADQLASISNAEVNLSNFDAMFVLQGAVSCEVVLSKAKWVTEHDEHGEKEGHGHEEEQGHEEEHGHEDHDVELSAEHAEFVGEYKLQCNDLDQLTGIKVNLFEYFEAIEELDVQMIHSSGQNMQELNAENTQIRL